MTASLQITDLEEKNNNSFFSRFSVWVIMERIMTGDMAIESEGGFLKTYYSEEETLQAIADKRDEFSKNGLSGYEFYPAILSPSTKILEGILVSQIHQKYLEWYELTRNIQRCRSEQGLSVCTVNIGLFPILANLGEKCEDTCPKYYGCVTIAMIDDFCKSMGV